MPPHRRDADTENPRRAGGRPRREGNAVLHGRALDGQLHGDLEAILRQRETLERKLADVDERLYDLESEYLKECVQLGGSLFDGYGVERSSFLSSGTTFLFASPTVVSPSSPLAACTNFPGSPSASSGAMGAFASAAATLAAAHSGGNSGTTTETSALAFRARTQNFTPAERLFSSTSVGAIGRVEQAKAVAAARGGVTSAAPRLAAATGRTGKGRRDPLAAWGVEEADSSVSGGGGGGEGGVLTRRRRRADAEQPDADDETARGRGSRRARTG